VMIIQNLLGQVIEVKHHHHTSMLEMKTWFLCPLMCSIGLKLQMSSSQISNVRCNCYLVVMFLIWHQYFSYIAAVSFIGGVPGENHWQTLSHNVVSSTLHLERDTDCLGSCNK
jgi:hypothetical protein